MQISVYSVTVVAHVSSAGELTPELRALLEDSSLIKVGVKVNEDLEKISKDFKAGCKGGCDLARMAKDRGVSVTARLSLQRLVELDVGKHLPKPFSLRRSAWDIAKLSPAQVSYAAMDSYASYVCFQALTEATQSVLTPERIIPGLRVHVMNSSCKSRVATGKLPPAQSELFGGAKVASKCLAIV